MASPSVAERSFHWCWAIPRAPPRDGLHTAQEPSDTAAMARALPGRRGRVRKRAAAWWHSRQGQEIAPAPKRRQISSSTPMARTGAQSARSAGSETGKVEWRPAARSGAAKAITAWPSSLEAGGARSALYQAWRGGGSIEDCRTSRRTSTQRAETGSAIGGTSRVGVLKMKAVAAHAAAQQYGLESPLVLP